MVLPAVEEGGYAWTLEAFVASGISRGTHPAACVNLWVRQRLQQLFFPEGIE
jgi:hypothetical protein